MVTLENLSQTVAQISQGFNTLSQIVAATTGISSNGSSTPPGSTPISSTPTPASSPPTPATSKSSQTSPVSLPEITALNPVKTQKPVKDNIVTADLEAIIGPDGQNTVFMAAWYNGNTYNTLDISQCGYNSNNMLGVFWQDLIANNFGKTVYFHNWAGYDSILSMESLLNLPGYTFNPILNNGEIMGLTVSNKGKIVLSIKDSIRILPGALGKLAKDWKVETQKDHFPHYFFLNDLKTTLNYKGKIPEYQFFEPKRTSLAEC